MWARLSRLFGKEEHETSLDGRVHERKMGAESRCSEVDGGKRWHQVSSPLGAHMDLEQ